MATNPAALTSPAVLVGLQIPGADGLSGPLTQTLSHQFVDLMVTVHPKKGVACLGWGSSRGGGKAVCIWLVGWIEGLPGHKGPSPVTLAFRSSCLIFSKLPDPKDSHGGKHSAPLPGLPQGTNAGLCGARRQHRGRSRGLGCKELSGGPGVVGATRGLRAA